MESSCIKGFTQVITVDNILIPQRLRRYSTDNLQLCFWPVSSLDNDGISTLISRIESESWEMEYSIVRTDVSPLISGNSWTKGTYDFLKEKGFHQPILTADEFDSWIATILGNSLVQSSEALKQIRSQLHTFGFLLDFSEEFNLIIVDPQWLMNAFKSIFSFK